MSNGIRTTNIERQFAIDELIGNVTDDGVEKTARIPMSAVTNQLAGSGPFVFGNTVYVLTRAELLAYTPGNETMGGVVLDDSNASYNGYYARSASAWVKGRGFPDSIALWTQTGGTANLLQVSTSAGVDPASVVLAILTATQSNSAAATVSINGASAVPILSASGAPLAAGEIVGGKSTLIVLVAGQWRVISSSQSFDFRGAWSGATTYVQDSVVESGGSLWLALTASLNVSPVEGASWTLFLPGTTVADGSVTAAKIGASNSPGVRTLLYTGTGDFWQADGAVIHRIADRIMVGAEAADYDGENPSSDTGDWPWDLRAASLAASQLGSISTIGHTGLFGGSKSTSNGVDGSQGTIGVYGMAWNDHTGTVSAYGGYFEAWREVGAGITHGLEVDIINRGSVVDSYPFLANPAGLTEGLRIASGGEDAGANAASVAISIIANGQGFRRGIIFQEGSLETGIALAMPAEYHNGWFGAGGGTARRLDNGVAATFYNGAGVEKGSVGFDDTLGILRIDAKSAGAIHFAGQTLAATAGASHGYMVIAFNGVTKKIQIFNDV